MTVLAGVLLAVASPAVAHPTLLFTDPGVDTAVAESPTSITLVFTEQVTIPQRALTLFSPSGQPIPMGEPTTARDGRVVAAGVPQRLGPGGYLVRWRVTGADGDVVEGEFRFAVGPALAWTGAAQGSVLGVSWPVAALRWMLFAGLAVAVGSAVAGRLTSTARAEAPALPAVRSWAFPGAVAGLAAVLGLVVLLRRDGNLAGGLWSGPAGRVLVVQAAGLLTAGVLILLRRPMWALPPLVTVAVADGWRSHANVTAPGWGAVSTAVHLAAAAVWLGALLHVARTAVTWRARPPAVWWVVSGYARLALWLFLTVVATGAVTALLLVPLPAFVTTDYGRLLLAKLALVAAAATVAVAARRLLRSRADSRRLGRAARAESAVLVAVLAVTAVLVSAPTPAESTATPFPPPARGLVVPVGSLAGQVGVSVAASDGQLVVRLATPRRGDYYGVQDRQSYRLAGQLTRPDNTTLALRLRGCGQGCFVAPVTWPAGASVLALLVGAPGWHGGTMTATIRWPPRPADEQLRRTVQAMQQAGELTIYEAVTSDTAAPLPDPQILYVTGAWFITTEPYSAATAPIAVQTSGPPDPIRLALSYPAEGRTAELVVDEHGRIAEETLTDAKHLIHRRFVYPDNR